jgi:hypothetical protein
MEGTAPQTNARAAIRCSGPARTNAFDRRYLVDT